MFKFKGEKTNYEKLKHYLFFLAVFYMKRTALFEISLFLLQYLFFVNQAKLHLEVKLQFRPWLTVRLSELWIVVDFAVVEP